LFPVYFSFLIFFVLLKFSKYFHIVVFLLKQNQIQELMTENNSLKEKLNDEVKRRMDLAERTQVQYINTPV